MIILWGSVATLKSHLIILWGSGDRTNTRPLLAVIIIAKIEKIF